MPSPSLQARDRADEPVTAGPTLHRTPEALEAAAWDRFVATAPGGDIVQTAVWAASKRPLGLETCTVSLRRAGEIVAGALLVIKRFGPLGAVAYVARGPLLAPGHEDRTGWVLDTIERTARARKVRYLIVQPPEGGEAIGAELARRGYAPGAPDVAPSATARIDLSPDLDAILAGMAASRRRDVRRSQDRGIEIRTGDRGDLGLFWTMHAATARRQGFTPLSLTYLRHQWDALAPRGSVQLIIAEYAGRPVAAAWVTGFAGTATYRIPAWSGEASHLRPNVACEWAVIRWAKEQGYRRYDLGGIDRHLAVRLVRREPLPEQLLRSPATFKLAFGARPILLPAAWQRTFDPLTRLVMTTAARFARHERAKRLINLMRNG